MTELLLQVVVAVQQMQVADIAMVAVVAGHPVFRASYGIPLFPGRERKLPVGRRVYIVVLRHLPRELSGREETEGCVQLHAWGRVVEEAGMAAVV
jgi:hypothetical protein